MRTSEFTPAGVGVRTMTVDQGALWRAMSGEMRRLLTDLAMLDLHADRR